MKKFALAVLICLTIVFAGCAFTSHPFFNTNRSDVETCYDRYLLLKADFEYVIEGKEHVLIDHSEGIAIPISEDTVLVLSHVAILEEHGWVQTIFGMLPISREIKKAVYKIDDVELEIVGSIEDVTVLRSKEKVFKPVPFSFGNSDLLKLGDVVCVIGNSALLTTNIKFGVVSSLSANLDKLRERGAYPPYRYPGAIVVSAPINSGDSGSLVLVNRNFGYEIVGIITARYGEGCGIMMPSNYVKDSIEKILSGESNEDKCRKK